MRRNLNSVRFSQCGTYLGSGGDEKILYVWKTNFTAVPSIRENLRQEENFQRAQDEERDPVGQTQNLKQMGGSLTIQEQSNFIGNRVKKYFEKF